MNPGYGTIRMLELPKDTAISGPGQVQNQFNSNPTAQNQLRLLNQNGSKVESGNLLTLPVGGGLLYVQPVYVRATGETSYPLLQYVFVAFGDQIGFAPTLDAALDQVFGGNPEPMPATRRRTPAALRRLPLVAGRRPRRLSSSWRRRCRKRRQRSRRARRRWPRTTSRRTAWPRRRWRTR